MKVVLSELKKDLERNGELKNHVFFYIFRYGNYCMTHNGICVKIFSILFRFVMKFTYNRYNHIPLETDIGGD